MNLPYGALFWLIETMILVSGLKRPLKPRDVCWGKSAVLLVLFARKMPLILTHISPLRGRIIYVSWRQWRTKAVFSVLPKTQGKHLKSPANLSDVPELNARASSILLRLGAHHTGFCSSLGVSLFWCSAVFYKDPQSAHVPPLKEKDEYFQRKNCFGF